MRPPADRAGMDDRPALDELARRLWEERQVVGYLLFKLTVAKLLLAADERRFVPDALREVERTVELLREGERRREDAVQALAEQWRASPAELTLAEIARRAGEPYDQVFRDHQQAFHELATEIDEVARENRTLARGQLGAVGTAMSLLAGGDQDAAPTYDARGRLDAQVARAAGRLREVL